MKRHAPAAARNRAPIAAALRDILPASGLVLEIASGSGEHAAWFAEDFPALIWQPSDSDQDALASIRAWCAGSGRSNLAPPIRLDASARAWPIDAADAILCVNMVHIAPWPAVLGLLDGAGGLLAPGAPLILYGPWLRDDVDTAPSNLAFDASLKARNPDWGLRDLGGFTAEAAARDLRFDRLLEMPANNIIAVFRRG